MPIRLLLPALLLSLLVSGCSIRKLALGGMADTLAAGGGVFASDDDPELIRDALPFGLKTMESLLVELPEHRNLLRATCSGFTQYAWGFVETDAELVEDRDFGEAQTLRGRALRLYARARDYCLRGLELRHPGIGERLRLEPEAAAEIGVQEMDLLYWTAVSWGAGVSVGRDRPEWVADLPTVIALLRRALELDERYEAGALHELMITIEALPANMGGSLDRAREHYARALELSGGRRASTHLTFASSVTISAQRREEFVAALERALAVDEDAAPDDRLQNRIVKRRARALLERVDDLFLE